METDSKNVVVALDLGVMPVVEAERMMRNAVELRRCGEIPDLLLYLAHPPTVSLGVKDRGEGRPADLLVPLRRLEDEGIALARADRGGGITYLWPGQVMAYPILLLAGRERHVPQFMARLERVAQKTLGAFGVAATTRRDTPAHVGLWWNGRKVVSMGVRLDHWVTSFGLAINLDGEHGPSRYVRPCGIPDATLITVRDILGAAPSRSRVIEMIGATFAEEFDKEIGSGGDRLLERLREGVEPVASVRRCA